MVKKIDYLVGILAIFAFFMLLAEQSTIFDEYLPLINKINITIISVFVLEVVLRFFASEDKKVHLRVNWPDLIVFIALIQVTNNIGSISLSVIVRQITFIWVLSSKVRKTDRFLKLLGAKPAQLMITTFIFAIASGSVLLMLPEATKNGMKMPFVDALFTATSATCVTGLTVRDTAAYFSLFGQIVILALIQIGGLGIMTFSVSLALILGKSMDVRQEAFMQDVLNEEALSGVKNMILFILKMTIIFEVVGTCVLFFAWFGKLGTITQTLYYAFFHSISAFCNAGFSTFRNNLMGFSGDILTNLTVCLLIITGGLGFVVIKDLYDNAKNKISGARRIIKIKIQTKIVLAVSLVLIIAGALLIYFFEREAAFKELDVKGKVLVSLFQSVSARTAGFNTCDFSVLSPATLFVIIILMFIGGSPGATAGGIKTTTIFVLWAVLISGLKNMENVEIFRRTISFEIIKKAVIMFLSSFILVIVFTPVLLWIEKKSIMDILFETISAFGTVGLSTGITAGLSESGKIMISLLMFIGRLGPLTIGYAFVRQKKPAKYTYAQESVAIG